MAILAKATFEELVPRGSKFCSFCNGIFKIKEHFRTQIDRRKGRCGILYHCKERDKHNTEEWLKSKQA
jgi:hypothetical protein